MVSKTKRLKLHSLRSSFVAVQDTENGFNLFEKSKKVCTCNVTDGDNFLFF